MNTPTTDDEAHAHVEGSPWQVGDLVIVTGLTDEDGLFVGNEGHVGLTGTVQRMAYECEEWLYLVLLENGDEDGFHPEELALAGSEVTIRRPAKVELRFVAMYMQEDAQP